MGGAAERAAGLGRGAAAGHGGGPGARASGWGRHLHQARGRGQAHLRNRGRLPHDQGAPHAQGSRSPFSGALWLCKLLHRNCDGSLRAAFVSSKKCLCCLHEECHTPLCSHCLASLGIMSCSSPCNARLLNSRPVAGPNCCFLRVARLLSPSFPVKSGGLIQSTARCVAGAGRERDGAGVGDAGGDGAG